MFTTDFVQLQVARLGEAMVVAQGDLQAMDPDDRRLATTSAPAETASSPPRNAAAARNAIGARRDGREIFLLAKP